MVGFAESRASGPTGRSPRGLKFRPIAVTALDTLEWFRTLPEERRNQLQLNLERDRQLLEEWRA